MGQKVCGQYWARQGTDRMIRAFATTVAASLTGLALAALICWLWLATIDGKQLDS